MSFDFDAPEDVGGSGKFLNEPGTYHLAVMKVHEGQMPEGKPIAGFCVTLSVLTGTVEGQGEKELNLTFFNGKLDSKDKGEFARKKQAAFLIATGLMTPAQLGQRVLRIDLACAEGRQVIATLEHDNRDGADKKFLQLAFANIFHPDDPRAAGFPKNAEALSLLPRDQRHPAEYFAPLAKKPASAPAAPVRPQLSPSQLAEL